MTKRNKNRIASLDGTFPPPPNHPPPEFLKHNNVTNVERQPAPPPPPPPGEPPERTNIARRNSGLQPPPPPPPVGWTETQNMSYAPKQDLKMTTAPPPPPPSSTYLKNKNSDALENQKRPPPPLDIAKAKLQQLSKSEPKLLSQEEILEATPRVSSPKIVKETYGGSETSFESVVKTLVGEDEPEMMLPPPHIPASVIRWPERKKSNLKPYDTRRRSTSKIEAPVKDDIDKDAPTSILNPSNNAESTSHESISGDNLPNVSSAKQRAEGIDVRKGPSNDDDSSVPGVDAGDKDERDGPDEAEIDASVTQLQLRQMQTRHEAKTNDIIEGTSIPEMNDHAVSINKNITNISIDEKLEKPSSSKVKLSRRESIQKLLRLKMKSKTVDSHSSTKINQASSSCKLENSTKTLSFPSEDALPTRHDREHLLSGHTQSLPASKVAENGTKSDFDFTAKAESAVTREKANDCTHRINSYLQGTLVASTIAKYDISGALYASMLGGNLAEETFYLSEQTRRKKNDQKRLASFTNVINPNSSKIWEYALVPPLAVLGLDTSQAHAATEGMVALISPLLSGSEMLLVTNTELPQGDFNVKTNDSNNGQGAMRGVPCKIWLGRHLDELEWVLENGVAAGRIPIREIIFADKVEDSEHCDEHNRYVLKLGIRDRNGAVVELSFAYSTFGALDTWWRGLSYCISVVAYTTSTKEAI